MDVTVEQLEAYKERQSILKEAEKKLLSQRWRLNHLYDIVTEKGEVIRFQFEKGRVAQKLLYLGLWYMNVILKSRQHGITTEMCIFFLDTCLFNSNTHACIIAHNKDDAKDFFTKKILFAYNNLPDELRSRISAVRASTHELAFSNGSSIRVTTSGRSGTYQLVHISEFGKMCAKYPHKAEEVITGTLNAIHPGQIVTIESTAEGREGKFYEICKLAEKAQQLGGKLTSMDWKFFFFGWFDNPLNQLPFDEAVNVPIPQRLEEYFDKVEATLKRRFTIQQKAWYVKKEAVQGELMFREHPSTPEEAFMAAVKGAYYEKQIVWLRKNGRIIEVPHIPGLPVNTYWDLGYNDVNAIWFSQTVGRKIHIIDYYENYNEGLPHYAQVLRDKATELGYSYGKHYVPHDIDVHDWSTGRTRIETARADYGLDMIRVPRLGVDAGIEMVRKILPMCMFDLEKCDDGLKCLESYRKEWDEKKGAWRDKPYHDWASNGADAFRTLAVIHPFSEASDRPHELDAKQGQAQGLDPMKAHV